MSHTAPKTLSDYRKDIDSALEDSFLRVPSTPLPWPTAPTVKLCSRKWTNEA